MVLAPALGKNGVRLHFSLKQLLLGGAVILGMVVGSSYALEWWTTGRFIESTDDAYVGGDVTAIAPHVQGFVSQVLVEDNQRIRKGQLLIQLDNREYLAAVDQAEAIVRSKSAVLDNLNAKLALQHSLISQAQAELSSKQSQAAFAHDDAIRYRGLARAVAVSRQDVQRAEAADQVAGSAVAQAHDGVAAANQQLAVLGAELAQAKADLSQAEANLETARLNLSYTQIRSPIDGTIGNRSGRRGAYATVGSELLSIVPARGLWIDANFKESQLAELRPGQSVDVEADVMPGHSLHGHVASVAPATGAEFSVLPPENATGNFTKIVQRVPVRIELDGDASDLGRLRPGLSVTAAVDTRG
jgi:membrane fusion protein (multidrug efflux system)